jgi:hypothetical protein
MMGTMKLCPTLRRYHPKLKELHDNRLSGIENPQVRVPSPKSSSSSATGIFCTPSPEKNII